MHTYYLIRHGKQLKVPGDPGLSELGKRQAELTGRYLNDSLNKSTSAIISSPFNRTKETAKYIAQYTEFNSKKIKIDKRLKERINWGDDPSLSFDKFLKIWNKTTIERDYSPSLGESSRKAGEILQSVINEANKFPNTNTVLLTHGGIILDLLRNIFTDTYLKSFKNELFEIKVAVVVGIHECSITELKYEHNKYFLGKFNFTEHLKELNINCDRAKMDFGDF